MMKVKKIPLRSCVITKERLPKQELLRIVKTKVQEIKHLQKEITKREYYHQDTSEQVQKWNKEVEALKQIPLYQDWITTQEKLNQNCQEIKSQL